MRSKHKSCKKKSKKSLKAKHKIKSLKVPHRPPWVKLRGGKLIKRKGRQRKRHVSSHLSKSRRSGSKHKYIYDCCFMIFPIFLLVQFFKGALARGKDTVAPNMAFVNTNGNPYKQVEHLTNVIIDSQLLSLTNGQVEDSTNSIRVTVVIIDNQL